MRNKSLSLVGILLLIISVYSVLTIKQSVLDLRLRYAEIERQLEQEKDTIHILRAELAYLQSPDRIEKLASKYLKLKPTKTAQMIDNPLNYNQENENRGKFANNKAHVRWRYKKSPSKYITTVSNIR